MATVRMRLPTVFAPCVKQRGKKEREEERQPLMIRASEPKTMQQRRGKQKSHKHHGPCASHQFPLAPKPNPQESKDTQNRGNKCSRQIKRLCRPHKPENREEKKKSRSPKELLCELEFLPAHSQTIENPPEKDLAGTETPHETYGYNSRHPKNRWHPRKKQNPNSDSTNKKNRPPSKGRPHMKNQHAICS
ncbi:hypothetical protein QPK87_36105 [Kamptonema cortianum]|nr:hypothetical protein [Kamptonema cortianum]